jgi:hypothetical protein
MSNKELEEYFEDLATRFKPVGHTEKTPHYCRFNIDEVVSTLRHNLDLTGFCLMLEAPSGTLEDNNGDGYYDNQETAFMIIRQVEVRNFVDERKTLSESRQLGVQLIGKIIEEGLFADLDESTIEYEKVGPVFGNCFGYRYTLTTVSEIAIVSNPDDWL